MKLKEVVIPAAGLGTRFLPYTKSIPKEMLPLINRPAIDYITQEIVASQIKDVNLVISKEKSAIIDYFSLKCQSKLNLNDKSKLFNIDNIINSVKIDCLFQDSPLGLGHAVSLVKDKINNDFFGVILPDDIINSEIPAIKQLMDVSYEYNASVIGIEIVPKDLVSNYGVIQIDRIINKNLFKINDLVEKPKIEEAPSNYAVVGRYVLSRSIFDFISDAPIGAKGEIQLTDAIAAMIKAGHDVYACVLQGKRYDIGTPLGWLKANIELSLNNPEYSGSIKTHIYKMYNEFL